ncbi:MAG TPA: metallophosphoesterase, partial [Steroidobacteraceae bacterium]|nr:metallophosphoesterase [Steroidobacteraceae bacterium]
MRIIIVSDTHLAHESIGQLSGDVLIHCGDFALGPGARDDDIDRLDAWFARQRFGLILCIGGNHDFLLEDFSSLALPTFRHAVYLQDEMAVYRGMRFFGAPWVPELQGWAFYLSNDELRAKWAAAPHDTDVLITHSPPSGVLDRNRSGRH